MPAIIKNGDDRRHAITISISKNEAERAKRLTKEESLSMAVRKLIEKAEGEKEK